MRDYPGTFVNVENNIPFGKHVSAIMAPELDVSKMALLHRNTAHMVIGAAGNLLENKVGVVDNFPGKFKPTELMDHQALYGIIAVSNFTKVVSDKIDGIKAKVKHIKISVEESAENFEKRSNVSAEFVKKNGLPPALF